MPTWGLSDDEVRAIVREADSNCDAGRALRTVLQLLVDANLQNADENDDTEEQRDAKSQAEASLFALATALTNGYRNLTPPASR